MSESDGNTPRKSPAAHLAKWAPGQSGNPSGRPKGSKGLSARIRDRTRDGEDILDVLMAVLTGEERATPRDRLEAAKILLDRGYGKAIETQVTVNANSLSAELAAEMADSHLEALARQLVSSVSTVTLSPPRLGIPSESLAIVVDEQGSHSPKIPPALPVITPPAGQPAQGSPGSVTKSVPSLEDPEGDGGVGG